MKAEVVKTTFEQIPCDPEEVTNVFLSPIYIYIYNKSAGECDASAGHFKAVWQMKLQVDLWTQTDSRLGGKCMQCFCLFVDQSELLLGLNELWAAAVSTNNHKLKHTLCYITWRS